MANQIKIENGTATIPPGRGYWDLSTYPWGGSFRRTKETIVAPVVRIISTFTDETPQKIVVRINGKDSGFQI